MKKVFTAAHKSYTITVDFKDSEIEKRPGAIWQHKAELHNHKCELLAVRYFTIENLNDVLADLERSAPALDRESQDVWKTEKELMKKLGFNYEPVLQPR